MTFTHLFSALDPSDLPVWFLEFGATSDLLTLIYIEDSMPFKQFKPFNRERTWIANLRMHSKVHYTKLAQCSHN